MGKDGMINDDPLEMGVIFVYPLVNCYITRDNFHRNSGFFLLDMLIFSYVKVIGYEKCYEKPEVRPSGPGSQVAIIST